MQNRTMEINNTLNELSKMKTVNVTVRELPLVGNDVARKSTCDSNNVGDALLTDDQASGTQSQGGTSGTQGVNNKRQACVLGLGFKLQEERVILNRTFFSTLYL